tara:strand:+ start:511 stop:681 length:171 start_codon:yes stop_codon:yes gene_type:complete
MQRITNNIGLIEWISINLLNVGALGLITVIPTMITCLVGVSILVLNGIKIYKEIKK